MSGSNSSSPAAKHGALDQPLGLTVHSLPLPQEAALADEQRTRTGRWKMLLVMLVCAAPVIASYLAYYVVRPDTRRSYGELIEPQRPIPSLTGTDLAGKAVSLPTLQGQWLLVSVAGGACDAACEKHLYLQRQLREALGKDRDRLDWVWLVPDEAPVRDALKPALAQATVLRVDAAQLAQWLAPARGHQLADHLYVVDPMGHWMMRFPPTQDLAGAAKVRKDLERLMRASAGWDQPGRPAN
ncbi:SCO family protein [Ramlibacter sp. AN1133]|uniref:SCO family protein n=1 Tax=Ramlibacter sp. AN1133 TaxID=3133429 RepID=UPI0030BF875E